MIVSPLVGSIAGGNCSVLKTSEYAHNTSKVIKEIIENVFEKKYIHVVNGGKEVNQVLLKENFDYIFFTGSTRVGKIVMESAAKSLYL